MDKYITTPYPDKTETLELLTNWAAHREAVDRLFLGVEKSIGLAVEGPLHETVWELFDAYTTLLEAQVGDFGGWLAWYVQENNMGKKAMAAGYDGKLRPIKTLVHLWQLIAESRKREGA